MWVETDIFFTPQNPYKRSNLNQYFKQHPEMVLGIQSMNGTMYHSDGYTVESDGRELGPAIRDALISVLPKGIIVPPVEDNEDDQQKEHEIMVGQEPTWFPFHPQALPSRNAWKA